MKERKEKTHDHAIRWKKDLCQYLTHPHDKSPGEIRDARDICQQPTE